MVYVQNIGHKAIGFGDVVILPNAEDGGADIKELPKGYSENHPVVKLMIAKKMLQTVDGPKEKKSPAEKTKQKTVSRMSLDELRSRCEELSIEYAEDETRADLMRKIEEYKPADGEMTE